MAEDALFSGILSADQKKKDETKNGIFFLGKMS